MTRNDRFRESFKKRIEKSKGKPELFVKKLCVEIDKRLVDKSPVDTGRFRANWMVGNGLVNTAISGRLSAPSNALLINTIKVNGQVIYMTNSLPYAQRLETGYSGQAPAGMVGITLVEINSIAMKIGVSLRKV